MGGFLALCRIGGSDWANLTNAQRATSDGLDFGEGPVGATADACTNIVEWIRGLRTFLGCERFVGMGKILCVMSYSILVM